MNDQEIQRSFLMLLAQMELGALVGLGVMENPATKEKRREPQQAALFIDQLEMLKAKTAGNLSGDESRVLDEALYRLRLAFVETGRQPIEVAKEPAEKKSAPEEERPA